MFEAELVNRVSVEEEPSSYRVGPQFGLDGFRRSKSTDPPRRLRFIDSAR
jgi:hypothetical protein